MYAHQDGRDHTRRTVKYPMRDNTDFLREMERPDQIDYFERVYAPLAILASIVFAAVSSFGKGDPKNFFWALSAILSISAPLGILCAFGVPYRNVSRKLLAEGAALASARQANRLRRVKEAVLRDGDLFRPARLRWRKSGISAAIQRKNCLPMRLRSPRGRGLEIGRVLSESLREQYGRPVRASNVTITNPAACRPISARTASLSAPRPSLASSASGSRIPAAWKMACMWSSTARLLVKSRSHTIPLRRLTARSMRSACIKVRPVIAAQDFNISPAMVESMFEMKHGTTDAVDPSRIQEVVDPRYAAKDHVCAILSKDGAMPYVMVQQAADKLVGALRSNLVIGTIAGVCGMLLMFYLTFKGAAEAVEPKNVLLYLLLWYVPVFVLSLTSRRNY